MRSETAQAPLFTATVDDARATIRARGHIDRLGADLLRGTVESLQRRGHRQITLQVELFSSINPEAHVVLRSLVTELRTRGVRLTVS